MKKESILTSKAPVPGGSYSQAVKIGDMVYVAGTAPFELGTTNIFAPGNLAAQTRLVLEYIQYTLEAAGSSLENVVKVTSFVTDMERFREYDEVYKQFFKSDFPARSTIEISKFPSFVEGMCVEIECVAYCTPS
jgi:2-iminobutanoate/2-iminopropanoate deaminase